jgi:peptidoglycan/xylan/chitin deacetylase (PgdA/CDA1 family)
LPRLHEKNWPFTLFINTEAIDRGYKNYLNWDQIRELIEAGIELGNHSHSHAHLVRRLEGETAVQWQSRVVGDIQRAADRLDSETGFKASLFAYPYGEYSPALKEIVRSLGYHGIAQQSGAVGTTTDLLAVPRFPMSTGFADLKRFSISVNSRPLPVDDVIASGSESAGDRLEKLLVTLGEGDYRADQLACYDASGTRLQMENHEGQRLRVSIALIRTETAGRKKINCTAPANSEPGVYYWFSYQWLVKHPDGRWYDE